MSDISAGALSAVSDKNHLEATADRRTAKSFVNTMIHELKRPVQALKMCIAFLNDKSMRTDEKAMDEVVHDSMSELDNLSAYLSNYVI